MAGIGDASIRALTKLQQVLPARLRYPVAALQVGCDFDVIERPELTDNPEALADRLVGRENGVQAW